MLRICWWQGVDLSCFYSPLFVVCVIFYSYFFKFNFFFPLLPYTALALGPEVVLVSSQLFCSSDVCPFYPPPLAPQPSPRSFFFLSLFWGISKEDFGFIFDLGFCIIRLVCCSFAFFSFSGQILTKATSRNTEPTKRKESAYCEDSEEIHGK